MKAGYNMFVTVGASNYHFKANNGPCEDAVGGGVRAGVTRLSWQPPRDRSSSAADTRDNEVLMIPTRTLHSLQL